MTSRKAQEDSKPNLDQQLSDTVKQALAGPGVADTILVYEAAEKEYSAAISSTIEEPRIWFSTSTQ